ncbi:MAG: HD domain-containing protein [Ruegeria sp.]|uniref:HD domain-containing protein n=1 Tax=Ruegeria sp. TaxID=1879320 RepID=UPI00349EE44E
MWLKDVEDTQGELSLGKHGDNAARPRDLLFHKTIRLAVSADVRLSNLETDIIDTADFQRLRRVQQLGASSWVYPTAVHTRFDHSIGVLKVVDEMITSIRDALIHVSPKSTSNADNTKTFDVTDEQRILARLYALLHDITHVPFGHTLEDELGIFDSHDAFQKEEGATDGIERFEKLLGRESEIASLIISQIGASMYERFREIYIKGKYARLHAKDSQGDVFDEFIYYLVSDTVCADLMDYLARDSYFCSLELRVPRRFLHYLYISDVDVPGLKGKRRRIVVKLWKPRDGAPRTDVMTDLAGILDSRYMLAERVYFHHAKVTVGAMIGRAVLEARDVGHLSSIDMLNFGDETLIEFLDNLGYDETHSGEREKIASKLAKAVRNRKIYSRVESYGRTSFSGQGNEDPYDHLIRTFNDPALRKQHEDEIALIAGAEMGDVLVYVAPEKMNMKISKAIVDFENKRCLLKDAKLEFLNDRLKTIEDSHRNLWRTYLLASRSLDKSKRELARLVFEAKFLPRAGSADRWTLLLHNITTNSNSFNNISKEDLMKAISRAASDLANNRNKIAHDRNSLEALNDAVRQYL